MEICAREYLVMTRCNSWREKFVRVARGTLFFLMTFQVYNSEWLAVHEIHVPS